MCEKVGVLAGISVQGVGMSVDLCVRRWVCQQM